MNAAGVVLDFLLAGALLGTTAVLLTSRNFLRMAVLFIVFGLFMAITWVRLVAPDIALVEAAIGAGITGVLLMDAIRHMEWERKTWHDRWPKHPQTRRRMAILQRIGAVAATLVLGALLLAAVRELPEELPGLAEAVAGRMEELEHPVTAVLMRFRALDTWLELGILLLAVMAMLAARDAGSLRAFSLRPVRDPVLEGVVRVLAPLAVVVAAYLLWLGTRMAGGAFQSGVILGALGILLWLSGHRSIDALPRALWKTLVVLGFGCFSLAAAGTMFVSERMLQYPDGWAIAIIEGLELASAISIGACFAGLFVGQHPGAEAFPAKREEAE